MITLKTVPFGRHRAFPPPCLASAFPRLLLTRSACFVYPPSLCRPQLQGSSDQGIRRLVRVFRLVRRPGASPRVPIVLSRGASQLARRAARQTLKATDTDGRGQGFDGWDRAEGIIGWGQPTARGLGEGPGLKVEGATPPCPHPGGEGWIRTGWVKGKAGIWCVALSEGGRGGRYWSREGTGDSDCARASRGRSARSS
jgi:hypothetical protein